jgi:NitT/TauT family transport system permease protein
MSRIIEPSAGTGTSSIAANEPEPRASIARRRRVAGASRKSPLTVALSIASVLAFVIFWQIASDTGLIRSLFFSSPLEVVRTGWGMILSGELAEDIIASGSLFITGFGLSVLLAIPLGMLIGWYRSVGAIFDPFITVLYVIPRIAIMPLIFVWFGVGFNAQVVIVFLLAFFPLLINTMAGMRSLDRDQLRVASSFMARDIDIFRTIALPASVPHIFSGIRHAMSMSLTGVVVAEFFMGNVGLGSLMLKSGATLRADRVFVGVVAIAVFALVFTFVMDRIDARLGRWRDSN